MNKKFIALIVFGLLVLGITQLAYATEAVVNEESEQGCFLDLLEPEARVKAENTIKEFHEVMNSLRARMAELRGTGDREARNEVQAEKREAQEAKREAIAELLPDEVREQYMERTQGQGKRLHAPEESRLRSGGKGGNGQKLGSTANSQ